MGGTVHFEDGFLCGGLECFRRNRGWCVYFGQQKEAYDAHLDAVPMKAKIWRTCLNHNGSLCHPEVRWCEFFPDPPTSLKSPFDPLADICGSCPHAVPVVREKHCPFCAGHALDGGSPRNVPTTLADPAFLYHYVCQDCGKDIFSKESVLANTASDAEGVDNGGPDG
jgi:hypothetical protein